MEINTINERLLWQIACSYRNAIVQAIQKEKLEPFWNTFPRGCCTGACSLLQRFYFEKGIETYIVYGQFKNSKYGHTWLETNDEVVIDITGDQFKDRKRHRFDAPVYVGKRENGFHDQLIQTGKDSYCPYDFEYMDPNARTYVTIMRFLE